MNLANLLYIYNNILIPIFLYSDIKQPYQITMTSREADKNIYLPHRFPHDGKISAL